MEKVVLEQNISSRKGEMSETRMLSAVHAPSTSHQWIFAPVGRKITARERFVCLITRPTSTVQAHHTSTPVYILCVCASPLVFPITKFFCALFCGVIIRKDRQSTALWKFIFVLKCFFRENHSPAFRANI